MDTATPTSTDTSAQKPAETSGNTTAQEPVNTTPHQEGEPKLPPPPTTTPPPNNAPPVKNASSSKKLISVIFGFVLLLVGLGVGYFAASSKPAEPIKPAEKNDEVTLPSDAVQIQACANNKGTLYVKPENIPVGPIYMVHNKKVIGIEFMLGKDEFIAGKSFKFLSAFRVKVDHVNLGLLSQGHEGFPAPHYHVDLYLVDKDYESKIICPNAAIPSQIPGPSVSAVPSGIVPSVSVSVLQPAPSASPSTQPY